MRLLIITQTVDSIDPILGFFHDWIRAFASRFESVVVLAQSVGSSSLPHNVMLVDLGKDTGKSKGMQTVSFWKEIVARRAEYDIVFVHMTPIWVLLGAPFWILLRKPMYLWYEIKRGSWKLTIASFFVKKIFAASEHGLPTVNRKQVTVGHGIDCAKFVPAPEKREKNHLIAVGRVTTIKHYEVLARAVSKLPHCTLTIAGGTITKSDKETEHALKELFHSLGIADRIEMGWVSPNDIQTLFQRADCMVHASQGGLDKVVLQAMACGCPVVSTSEAAKSVLPPECHATPATMAEKVEALLALSPEKRDTLSRELRSIVERDHSLSQCIDRIVFSMQ